MERRFARSLPATIGLGLALCVGGCGNTDEKAASPKPSLDGSCSGTGSPTVVLEVGISGGPEMFEDLMADVSSTTRVCAYARAGNGKSPPLPSDAPDPAVGAQADQLLAALEDDGIEGPYVMLGWSYGGIVTQAFVNRHPEAVVGVVFEDSGVVEQFTDPDWDMIDWTDGGRAIDKVTSTEDVAGLDLGSLPLVVLTQDQLTGKWARSWLAGNDQLASLSDNSVHVIAVGSGHELHKDAQELVAAAIDEVVAAARSGDALAACDARFAAVGGRCR